MLSILIFGYSSSVCSKEAVHTIPPGAPSTSSTTPSLPRKPTCEKISRLGKRRKISTEDDVEKALVSSLQTLQGDKPDDEEGTFGEHVASRLRQFTARQKAIAYSSENTIS